PRSPSEAILSRGFVNRIGLYGVLITAVALGAFIYALETGDLPRAVTFAFMTLALAQLFHLGNARSRAAVIRPRDIVANRWALAAVAIVIVLQLAAVYVPPLAGLLDLVPLRPADWAIVVPLSLL